MQNILKYFPKLTDIQIQQFEQLEALYTEWNAKINVISRKDIDNLYERHVLHSMAIAKFINFKSGSDVLDVGTGGGFPGIPLAILFPHVRFHLIDGTRKKISVVQAVVDELGLKNVKPQQLRAEETKAKYDFVVTRAVATIDKLMLWSTRLLKHKPQHSMPNGLIALKGGKIKTELKLLPKGTYSEITPLSNYFKEEFFEEKYLVFVQA